MERSPNLLIERTKAVVAAGLAVGAMAIGAATARGETTGYVSPLVCPNTMLDDNPNCEPPGNVPPAPGEVDDPGVNYYYAGAHETMAAAGASVKLFQANPELGANDSHTLAELAVISSHGKQMVEVGWQVFNDQGHVSDPELFVFRWVDGVGNIGNTSCYNSCGFVPLPGPVQPGDNVEVGTTGKYAIQYTEDKWLISYNDQPVGYYPESIWDGRFTQVDQAKAFGEVATDTNMLVPTSEMGNGILGSQPGSATISEFTQIDPIPSLECPSSGTINPYSTAVNFYDYGSVTADGLSFGGPGVEGAKAAASASQLSPESFARRMQTSFQVNSCRSDNIQAIQDLSQLIKKHYQNNPKLRMPVANSPSELALKIPTENGMIVMSGKWPSELKTRRFDPTQVTKIHLAEYKKRDYHKKLRDVDQKASLDFVLNRRGEWVAKYIGAGPLGELNSLDVKVDDAFNGLLGGAMQIARTKPGQPQPRI